MISRQVDGIYLFLQIISHETNSIRSTNTVINPFSLENSIILFILSFLFTLITLAQYARVTSTEGMKKGT